MAGEQKSHMQGAWVRSLVGEQRSQMPQGAAAKKKKKRKKTINRSKITQVGVRMSEWPHQSPGVLSQPSLSTSPSSSSFKSAEATSIRDLLST